MTKRRFVTVLVCPVIVLTFVLCWIVSPVHGQSKPLTLRTSEQSPNPKVIAPLDSVNNQVNAARQPSKMRGITNAQRKAAAAQAARRRSASPTTSTGSLLAAPKKLKTSQKVATSQLSRSSAIAPMAQALAGPALTADQLYFGTYPNYANSPLPSAVLDPITGAVTGVAPNTGIRKFVDPLPPLGCTTNQTKCIPIAVPDVVTFPGSDYYEIELVQYTEKLHSDLPQQLCAGTCRSTMELTHPLAAERANLPARRRITPSFQQAPTTLVL